MFCIRMMLTNYVITFCHTNFVYIKHQAGSLFSMLDILSISVENGSGGAPDEVSANPLVAIQEESCVCVLRRPALTPNVEWPNTLQNTTGLQFISLQFLI